MLVGSSGIIIVDFTTYIQLLYIARTYVGRALWDYDYNYDNICYTIMHNNKDVGISHVG